MSGGSKTKSERGERKAGREKKKKLKRRRPNSGGFQTRFLTGVLASSDCADHSFHIWKLWFSPAFSLHLIPLITIDILFGGRPPSTPVRNPVHHMPIAAPRNFNSASVYFR